MNIRIANKKDLLPIMTMIGECIKRMEALGICQWNERYPDRAVIEADIMNGHGYIFEEDNHCVAYVAINEEQSPEYIEIPWTDSNNKALIVHRLAVHPACQGKGFAKELMNFVETHGTNNNYSSIRLDAYSHNPAALGLYDRLGFKRLGQVFFPYREFPFYCFEKVLDSDIEQLD